MIPLDISQLDGDVQREFLNCRHHKTVAALAGAVQEQEAVGADTRAMGDRRSVEGLGQPVLEIAPTAFHYWGMRLGYQCWRDKQFVREFARDNPAARVKAGGTKVQVGYTGATSPRPSPPSDGGEGVKLNSPRRGSSTSAGASGHRFSKSYGEKVGERALAR